MPAAVDYNRLVNQIKRAAEDNGNILQVKGTGTTFKGKMINSDDNSSWPVTLVFSTDGKTVEVTTPDGVKMVSVTNVDAVVDALLGGDRGAGSEKKMSLSNAKGWSPKVIAAIAAHRVRKSKNKGLKLAKGKAKRIQGLSPEMKALQDADKVMRKSAAAVIKAKAFGTEDLNALNDLQSGWNDLAMVLASSIHSGGKDLIIDEDADIRKLKKGKLP